MRRRGLSAAPWLRKGTRTGGRPPWKVRRGIGRASSLLLALSAAVGCRNEGAVTVLKAALSQNPSEPQVRAVERFASLVEEGTVSQRDLALFQYVETAEEAWGMISALLD